MLMGWGCSQPVRGVQAQVMVLPRAGLNTLDSPKIRQPQPDSGLGLSHFQAKAF